MLVTMLLIRVCVCFFYARLIEVNAEHTKVFKNPNTLNM